MRKRLGKTPKSLISSHLTPKQRLTSPMLSRASALSPAAKNLLQRSLKSPSARSLMKGLSSDYKLKSSYNSPLLCNFFLKKKKKKKIYKYYKYLKLYIYIFNL